MKKVGVITTNRVFAQSLVTAINTRTELQFEVFSLLNQYQVALDAEVLKLDVALIDVIDGRMKEVAAVLELCQKLRQVVPDCRFLLLVSQDDAAGREMAIAAIRENQADDFVFYDTSLDYLVAKLAAI